MNEQFTLLLRVRYGECDAQQVVFNARYADYADIAATEYVRALFGGYQNIIEKGMDTQVVNLTINWQAPAKFDDVLALKVTTGKTGNSSYRLDIQFVNHANGQPIASAELTYVMVDTTNYKTMSMPDDFKSRLKQGANILVDQAG